MSLDKFKGCILGGMCGDVLGATVEGANPDLIAKKYPNGLTRYEKHGPRPYGKYTDDSQMTIALLKSLTRDITCNPFDCAKSYANDFEVHRGYGETAFRIMQDLRNGADYKTTATKYLPGGSYANGGAMRIAPIGLVYANDQQNMLQAVKNALLCTHVHPDAIDGAYIQALAVSLLYNTKLECFDTNSFLEKLEESSTSDLKFKIWYIKNKLHSVSRVSDWTSYLNGPEWQQEIEIRNTVSERFQIKATDAVACSLLAFCTHWEQPEAAVIAAVHYGGDTDTVAAMTGNLAFALHGETKIPKEWLEHLENKDIATSLCENLLTT
jgi:poly(ADP-ribose) glycohydrolase ARH3